jgi:galactokinase
MTGGGFGGCTVSLVRKDHLDRLVASIASDYLRLTGIVPTMFTTRPAQGTQVLPQPVE